MKMQKWLYRKLITIFRAPSLLFWDFCIFPRLIFTLIQKKEKQKMENLNSPSNIKPSLLLWSFWKERKGEKTFSFIHYFFLYVTIIALFLYFLSFYSFYPSPLLHFNIIFSFRLPLFLPAFLVRHPKHILYFLLITLLTSSKKRGDYARASMHFTPT